MTTEPNDRRDLPANTDPLLIEPAADEPEETAPAEPAFALPASGTPSLDARPPKLATPAAAGNRLLIQILLTWASLATIIAVWQWLNWPEAPSHLENLPDDGAFSNGKVVSPFERLSSRSVFHLGETRRVGDLEITPLGIEERPVRILPQGGLTEPVLVLRLRIKNLSETPFRATDPAFLYPNPKRQLEGMPRFKQRGFTYSFLHPANAVHEMIFCYDLVYEQGLSIEGQDHRLLQPGEAYETVVVSEEDVRQGLRDPMLWRIKLRKGVLPSGKGVATVIAVAFSPRDIVTG